MKTYYTQGLRLDKNVIDELDRVAKKKRISRHRLIIEIICEKVGAVYVPAVPAHYEIKKKNGE